MIHVAELIEVIDELAAMQDDNDDIDLADSKLGRYLHKLGMCCDCVALAALTWEAKTMQGDATSFVMGLQVGATLARKYPKGSSIPEAPV